MSICPLREGKEVLHRGLHTTTTREGQEEWERDPQLLGEHHMLLGNPRSQQECHSDSCHLWPQENIPLP